MQRSFLIFAVAFVALMAGALFYAARIPVQTPVPEPVAEPMETGAFAPFYPSFQLTDMDGAERDFSEWQGKHRLLNFWATWCAPCRREIPLLKNTQDTHAGNNLQIIGIAVDFLEPVQVYAEETDFNYPILVGQEDAMAAAEASGIEFIGMPFTMVVAPGGQLLKTHIGEIVESHIETILGVFEQLEAGEIGLAGARTALKDL